MQANDLQILRAAAIPTALAGLVAVVVAAFLAGAKGALGAGIGVLVVAAFFTISLVAVTYAARISPTIMMAAALGTFLTKILVLAVTLEYFQDATVWTPEAFSLTVVACTILWTIGEARGFLKLRILYVDPTVKVPGQVEEKRT
jgi:ATP synthase protein I